MFIFKNRVLYFFIALLIGVNLLKNIYVEKQIRDELNIYSINTVGEVDCKGFVQLECMVHSIHILKGLSSDVKYTIDIDEISVSNFNILNQKNIFDNNLKLNFKNIYINDSNNSLNRLSKPISIKSALIVENKGYLEFSLKHSDLNIDANLTFEDRDFYKTKVFSSLLVSLESKNDIVKEIVYELYKLKFLEKREKDGVELSRGINRSLGVDTDNVIPKKIFLEEPYRIVSMLLIAEIEILDIVYKYNENEDISQFLRDVLTKNGVHRLNIKAEKDSR